MKRMIVGLILATVLAAGAWADTGLRSVLGDEAAYFGATHAMDIKYSDLAVSTSTNTALLISNTIPVKTGVRFVGMVLKQAFDTANTNYTGSVNLVVGDGSDAHLFLTSTELASDGTEVFVKYGPVPTAVVTMSGTNGVTTNLTGSATLTELGQKLYTSAGYIVCTLTPNTEEALASNTKGWVRLYFRLLRP